MPVKCLYKFLTRLIVAVTLRPEALRSSEISRKEEGTSASRLDQPRPQSLLAFHMAAAREKTLAHSDLKRSLIGAILTWVLIGYVFQKQRWRIFVGSSCNPNISISRSLWCESWTVFLFDNLQNCSCSVWGRSEVPNPRFVDYSG